MRGHFHKLSDGDRRALLAASDDHEIFKAAYTAEGTLSDATVLAAEQALAKARASLSSLGLDHRRLRATATNMASIWS